MCISQDEPFCLYTHKKLHIVYHWFSSRESLILWFMDSFLSKQNILLLHFTAQAVIYYWEIQSICREGEHPK